MKNIKGTTKVCGIIGNPIEHSISPLLHNTLSDIMGIDLAYVPFRVEHGDVKAAVNGAYSLNIFGMNVTVPHKSSVIEALADIDPLAESIGAVNTLVRTNGGYKGYNTDILGLKRELDEAGICLDGNEVIILGAGGAARAIAFLCADGNASRIHILNRTLEKAEGIAVAVNEYFGLDVAQAVNIADYRKLTGSSYICIQTTSVGLYPNTDEAPIEDECFYDRIKAGVDIIYNPAETKFMRLLKESNGTGFDGKDKIICNGLKMLLYQGISAFELWNGISVSDEKAMVVYEAMKKEMGIND